MAFLDWVRKYTANPIPPVNEGEPITYRVCVRNALSDFLLTDAEAQRVPEFKRFLVAALRHPYFDGNVDPPMKVMERDLLLCGITRANRIMRRARIQACSLPPPAGDGARGDRFGKLVREARPGATETAVEPGTGRSPANRCRMRLVSPMRTKP